MKGSNPATTTSTQNTTLDKSSQGFLDEFRKRALANQQGGLPPGLEDFNARANQMTQGLDFATQTGLGGIDQFLNPELANVIGGVRGDFDLQRADAINRAGAEAEGANAFGGSRSGILQAQAVGDVNRNEASTIAGLRSNASWWWIAGDLKTGSSR